MTGTRVLVVDDEPQIHRFLRPALEASGHTVIGAATAAEALRAIANSAPDIVLLDLGLPDMDGKEVISRARSFSKVPIIVLSVRDREAEKIAALDLGADDYVEKPFEIGELMARLRAALRHKIADAGEAAVFESGGLLVDTVRRIVTRDGEAVKLTPKEYDLLTVLVRNAGRVVTHRQLLTAVWGPAHTEDTQYLRVFIGQLRQKIEVNSAAQSVIRNEPGIGYRLLVP
jgi:two-component system, OmpR family, KDP operon response regulator KdpE